MQSRSLLVLLVSLLLVGCAQAVHGQEPLPPSVDEPIRQELQWESVQVLVRESYPMQAVLVLKGMLPTPCHQLQWEVSPADEAQRIHVRIWSEVEADQICSQVLQPFEQSIELGDFTDTGYSVWIHGAKVGEF